MKSGLTGFFRTSKIGGKWPYRHPTVRPHSDHLLCRLDETDLSDLQLVLNSSPKFPDR